TGGCWLAVYRLCSARRVTLSQASACSIGPIKAGIANPLQAGVFTGMWHLITINFALSAIALFVLGVYGRGREAAWLAAPFAGYAVVYLAISLRLGGVLRLFQWMPFGITAILAAIGAQMAH